MFATHRQIKMFHVWLICTFERQTHCSWPATIYVDGVVNYHRQLAFESGRDALLNRLGPHNFESSSISVVQERPESRVRTVTIALRYKHIVSWRILSRSFLRSPRVLFVRGLVGTSKVSDRHHQQNKLHEQERRLAHTTIVVTFAYIKSSDRQENAWRAVPGV